MQRPSGGEGRGVPLTSSRRPPARLNIPQCTGQAAGRRVWPKVKSAEAKTPNGHPPSHLVREASAPALETGRRGWGKGSETHTKTRLGPRLRSDSASEVPVLRLLKRPALWTPRLCPPPRRSRVESLSPSVAVLGDRASKDVVKVKRSPRNGALMWRG